MSGNDTRSDDVIAFSATNCTAYNYCANGTARKKQVIIEVTQDDDDEDGHEQEHGQEHEHGQKQGHGHGRFAVIRWRLQPKEEEEDFPPPITPCEAKAFVCEKCLFHNLSLTVV